MLLTVDVGNSNIVLGLFEGAALRVHWRLATSPGRTGDEHGLLVLQLLARAGLGPEAVEGVVIGSVVPSLERALRTMAEGYLGRRPLFVDTQTPTGLRLGYEEGATLGVDRLVNAVAAWERRRAPLLVVDVGTATTIDAVTGEGELLGGAILPGPLTALAGLLEAAPRLPRVDLVRPARAIGRTTRASLQSGLVLGCTAQIDGLCAMMAAELGGPRPAVIATGGLAELLAPCSRTIESVEPFLTLDGLRIIHERNR